MPLNAQLWTRTRYQSVNGAIQLRGRVLVVDDSDTQRDAIVRALRGEGFEVIESSGAHARDAVLTEPLPDVIALGMTLPEYKSFDLCRELKAASKTLLPVVCVSSRTSREARVRALDNGCDAYVAHPFDASELRAVVAALVRLKGHESLREHEPSLEPLNEALNALADHVALLARDGTLIAVNRSWADFAIANGYREGGTGLGANYLEVCEKATGAGSEEAHASAGGIRRVLLGETDGFEIEYPCAGPDGERWFRMSVRRMSGPGSVAAIVTHAERTSERLAAEAEALALSRAEEDRRRLEGTLAALPIGVWLSDASGRLTHKNPAAELLWRGTRELPVGVEGYAVYPARDPKTGELLNNEDRALARTLRTGTVVENFIVDIDRFDGTRGTCLTSAAPIHDGNGTITGAVAIAVDITEREASIREKLQLTNSLESERARLAAVFELAPSFLAVLRGPDYVFERVNPAYMQLVGHRDPVGMTLLDALPEIEGQGFIEILDGVRNTGESFSARQLPVRLARSAGAPLETRYVNVAYQRLIDSDGNYAVVSHGVDVTEAVVATQTLQRTEERLRDQFAKLPVATFLWEEQGEEFILADRNEVAVRVFPQFGARPIGKTTLEIFTGADGFITRSRLRKCLRENQVLHMVAEFAAGSTIGERTVEFTLGPQQPNRVLVHAVDTTERIELESQLRQAQKMDAVGRLAGGVAHDFNNLLTVIGAHSAFLLESLDSNDVLHEDAEAIHKAGIRAAGLTRQLLAFSRKQILKPSLVDVNAVVTETRKMLGRLIGEDIEIALQTSGDQLVVVADASQLDQVVVNLAVNARDAMPEGGMLDISTSLVAFGDKHVESHRVVPAGEYVMLQVSDTGVGMDATVRARLFEPFFTTKGPGKGTGLGLATVYGIIKQSQGFITVDSEAGEGTTFRIYLPRATDTGQQEELRSAENIAVRGAETVLLIEDESAVREIAKRVLVRHGYVVLQAGNGTEALAVSKAFDSPIHLVISDAVMPGMSGAEVVRRLQEARPNLKALFMSGYTDDEILRRGIISSASAFLQKPFSLADFARAARDVLDSK